MVLESVLLKCCLLLFLPSVSAGGPAAQGGMEPGETFLESDEPVGTQIRKPWKRSPPTVTPWHRAAMASSGH